MAWFLVLALQGFWGLTNDHYETDLKSLPVQWSQVEQWVWQGQKLSTQGFKSEKDAASLLKALHDQLDSDLYIQRLPTAWVVSFERQHTHYLMLLHMDASGSSGWLSRMFMRESRAAVPSVFNSLYEHSWSTALLGDDATYMVLRLQPYQQKNALLHLKQRLNRLGWQPVGCIDSKWCSWTKSQQYIQLWIDQTHLHWHILWRTGS